MAIENKIENMVRVYRDESKSDDVIIEVLGEPVLAMKQMKAEAFTLREKKTDESPR